MGAPIAGIYLIRHRESGRCYVGQSMDIESRWSDHRWALNKKCHHSRFLQRAWVKHGADAFEWLVLVEESDSDKLTELEQYYMDALPSDFNGRPAATSMLGFKMPPEAIEKMRSAAIERSAAPSPAMLAYWERMRGQSRGIYTAEHGAAISNAKKGKSVPWTAARREAAAIRAANPSERQLAAWSKRKGRKLTDEHKAKISAQTRAYLQKHGHMGAVTIKVPPIPKTLHQPPLFD